MKLLRLCLRSPAINSIKTDGSSIGRFLIDDATRRHVRTVHGCVPVNALIITTRTPTLVESADGIELCPLPLDSKNLLHLMTSLLREVRLGRSLAGITEQLDLANRLAKLIRVEKTDVPLTPLLVKLYLDKAISLAKEGNSFDALPTSVPDAYFDYLRQVNPQGDEVKHGLTHEQMLNAAGILGRLALGEEFVPREFSRTSARHALAESQWVGPKNSDPVERLLLNGVIVSRDLGGDQLLRFVLDPVAEFLAAMEWGKRCGENRDAWQSLGDDMETQGEGANGFATALRLTCLAYGDAYRWAYKSAPNIGATARTLARSGFLPP